MDLAARAGITDADAHKAKIVKAFAYALSVFVYVADQVKFGMPERWPTRAELEAQLAPAGGRVTDDCDGFAMLCRFILDDCGIENHLVYCQVLEPGVDQAANGHLVTMDIEGWVLDCRQQVVTTQAMLNYRWVSFSGIKPGDPWYEVAV